MSSKLFKKSILYITPIPKCWGYTYRKDFEHFEVLSEMFFDYVEHKEEKYDGNIGVLTRQRITLDNVIHIGKESNNLEETEILGVSDNDYVTYDNASEQKIIDSIKNMTNQQAKINGILKQNCII